MRELAEAYSASASVRRIAVVGNAPMEPSAARAAEIDAADLVIRANSFVTDRPGDPPVQGSCTHVVLFSRMVPATPDFFDRYRERLYVLLEPMRMYGRPEVWPANWPDDLGFAVARNDAVAIPINEALGLPWREQQLAPTTGTTAAWLAMNLFPEAEVLLTGISFVDDPTQTAWRHQWGDATGVGPEHRIAAEADLVRGWIDSGRLRFLPLTGDD